MRGYGTQKAIGFTKHMIERFKKHIRSTVWLVLLSRRGGVEFYELPLYVCETGNGRSGLFTAVSQQ